MSEFSESSKKKGWANGAKKVAGVPIKVAQGMGAVAKFGWEHPKFSIALGLSIGATVLGEHATWGKNIDKYQDRKVTLTDQDANRGAKCFSDGVELGPDTVVRKSTALMNSKFGPTSDFTGLWQGNVAKIVEDGESIAVRQPRIWQVDNSQWMAFTVGKVGSEPKTPSQIAKVTYVVNLQPYSDGIKNGEVSTITTFDTRSTEGALSFNMPCVLKPNGQTTLNNQEAAFASIIDGEPFKDLIK